jgi:hypothetical protein
VQFLGGVYYRIRVPFPFFFFFCFVIPLFFYWIGPAFTFHLRAFFLIKRIYICVLFSL